jgi:hypothetical protein
MVIHVIGDSHTKTNFGADPRFVVHYLGPMSMHHVAQKREICLKDFDVENGDTIIWCFGEIYVRCHLIRQRDEQRANISGIADALAMGYIHAILDIKFGYENLKIIVLAIIPPSDQSDNIEFPRIGELYERVWAQGLLNQSLNNYCILHDFIYIDPYGEFINSAGSLKPEMSDYQVHVGEKYAHLIVEKVMECLK